MAYPRRQPALDTRRRIDARSQKVKEAGLTDAHLGMGGEVLSGVDEKGTRLNFPAKPAVPTAPKTQGSPSGTSGPLVPGAAASGPINYKGDRVGASNYMGQPIKADLGTPAAATAPGSPLAAPRSAMQTGNPRVTFPSVQERTQQMQDAAQAKFEAGRTAVAAAKQKQDLQTQQEAAGVFRRPAGTPGGLITGLGGRNPQLSSIYGSGAAVQKDTAQYLGLNSPRIADETGDRTAEIRSAASPRLAAPASPTGPATDEETPGGRFPRRRVALR